MRLVSNDNLFARKVDQAFKNRSPNQEGYFWFYNSKEVPELGEDVQGKYWGPYPEDSKEVNHFLLRIYNRVELKGKIWDHDKVQTDDKLEFNTNALLFQALMLSKTTK